ncbi:Protein WHAT'S THIS FACTOR 9, mitochondrial [Linum perenne]
MIFMFLKAAKLLPHNLRHCRTFIAVRIKWVPDEDLDAAVSKEKDFKQVISIKNHILTSPSKSLPLTSISLLKPNFELPMATSRYLSRFRFVFSVFQPSPSLPLHVKLTRPAFKVQTEEEQILSSSAHRDDTVKRLARVLMLCKGMRLPLDIIDRFKLDLGLPHDYVSKLLSDYPDYFQIVGDGGMLCLELVKWRDELAVSEMERRMALGDLRNVKKGARIGFLLSYPKGFDLIDKVKDWVFEWQHLPYVSPYENAYHLNADSDQAEKWTVAVLHELMWLLVSKKTESDNVLLLGEYLGLRRRFKRALIHHPGIFYLSHKIRTQTVVLREAYSKDLLKVKHPLMGMRFRYIHLMNIDKERRRKRKLERERSLRNRVANFRTEEMGRKQSESMNLIMALMWLLLMLKKIECENVLLLGEYLGLQRRFKLVLIHHPGISKDLKHPLMGMKFRYIHLTSIDKERRRKRKLERERSLRMKIQVTCESKTEFHVLILGIDKAGKTTLLEKLKTVYSNSEGIPPDRIVPTVGLNIGRLEVANSKLVFWDLGGQIGLRSIWEKYYEEAHAVVFVIDAASPSRFEDAKSALEKVLRHDDLQGAPLLVMANKQDLPDAVKAEELGRYLDLKKLDERVYMFEAVSAYDGLGIKGSLEWLVEAMERSKRTETLRLRAGMNGPGV